MLITSDNWISYWYRNGEFYEVENMVDEIIFKGKLSPNKETIAFISHKKNIKRLGDLKVYNEKEETLNSRYILPYSNMIIRNLSWSPDSKWIAFYGGTF